MQPKTESDCWIGKNSAEFKKFNISFNHIHYNRTAVDGLMVNPYFKITILREPETQFVSSFKVIQMSSRWTDEQAVCLQDIYSNDKNKLLEQLWNFQL